MFLSKKEIAQKMGVSVSTVQRMMSKGIPYLKVGKLVKFEEEEVIKWIKEKSGKSK